MSLKTIHIFFFLIVMSINSSFGQKISLYEKDTLITNFTIWEDIDRDFDKIQDFNPPCITAEDDTISLKEYLYREFKYPEICVEMGAFGNSYFKILLDKNGKVTGLECLRPMHCEDEAILEQLTNHLKELHKIFCYVTELTIKINTEVRFGPHEVEKPYVPIILERR